MTTWGRGEKVAVYRPGGEHCLPLLYWKVPALEEKEMSGLVPWLLCGGHPSGSDVGADAEPWEARPAPREGPSLAVSRHHAPLVDIGKAVERRRARGSGRVLRPHLPPLSWPGCALCLLSVKVRVTAQQQSLSTLLFPVCFDLLILAHLAKEDMPPRVSEHLNTLPFLLRVGPLRPAFFHVPEDSRFPAREGEAAGQTAGDRIKARPLWGW